MPKRTINEIYELINRKYQNAYVDYIRMHEQNNKTIFECDIKKFTDYQMNIILEYKLKAYCECYLDIMALIESSNILHDNKELTLKQQNVYDNVISVINHVLEDADTTKQFLIDKIDELVEVIK